MSLCPWSWRPPAKVCESPVSTGLVWRERARDEAPWFAAVVAFFIVVNVGETAIAANRLAWMLLVAVAVLMASPSPTDSTD
jgi:hypothetical protein